MNQEVTSPSATPAALDHLRVLDLSRILAGPWATQTLADLGAHVVKVESPTGDDTRRWGPPFMQDGQGADTDAAYFGTCNRNKQSVTIDFAKPEGAELIRQMAQNSDVLVENFKLGGLKKYGLDYASLKAINPKLVYCSITGFGQAGPYAHRAGYDFLMQGMGGLMSITGQPDGSPGAEPVKVGVAVTDLFTGMYAVVSILAALAHRDKTGEGQHIDCSLMDSQVAMLANQASSWLNGATNPTRMGNNHPNVVPYRAFAASDGFVIITCGNDAQFKRLCNAMALEELAQDPRCQTNSDRVKNRDLVDSTLAGKLSTYSRAELIALLESVQVPCGPINDVADVFNDQHAIARNLAVNLPRADGTQVKTVAYPANLSATPAQYRHAPPKLGADTDATLSEILGLDKNTLDQLKDRGVI